jgi:hypothetical protein
MGGICKSRHGAEGMRRGLLPGMKPGERLLSLRRPAEFYRFLPLHAGIYTDNRKDYVWKPQRPPTKNETSLVRGRLSCLALLIIVVGIIGYIFSARMYVSSVAPSINASSLLASDEKQPSRLPE